MALWEIEKWTGLRVDTFVNFLKLPDTVGKSHGATEEREIRIREAGGLADEAFARVEECKEVEVPEELKCEGVNGAYLYAIDVEATVRKGALDIGVFGLEEMVGLGDVERLAEDVRGALMELGLVELTSVSL